MNVTGSNYLGDGREELHNLKPNVLEQQNLANEHPAKVKGLSS